MPKKLFKLMSAAEPVKPESDKDETGGDNEASSAAAEAKASASQAAAAGQAAAKAAAAQAATAATAAAQSVNKQAAKVTAKAAKTADQVQAAVEEQIITQEASTPTGGNTSPYKRTMKRATKTRQVELEPPGDQEEVEEVEEEEGEPSQAVIALQNALGKLLGLMMCAVKSIGGLICCGVRGVIQLIPTSLHMALFLSLLYALSEYVVTPLPNYVDFVGRLRYMVRCLAWTLTPAVLGYCTASVKKAEGHKKFAEETFKLVAMLACNSAVFATYAASECMHYIWTLQLLVAVYSMGYWASLIYGGPFTRKCFRQPTLGILLLLMAWNFWTIVSQDAGWDDAQPSGPAPQPSSGDRGLHYWQYATMCEMVERVFCTIDQGPRMYYL